MINNDLKTYAENLKEPWWLLFYRIVWEQMPIKNGVKILDFGSGLGVTANHLAKDNEVVAIEPNKDMIKMRIDENVYEQMFGDIEILKQQKDESFDVIVCHNVFEYAKDRKDIFKEFYRVLKTNGIISIVKHNHVGRIMQKAVFENNLDEAIYLLDGGRVKVINFGEVNYYNISDIKQWIGNKDISIEKILGVRTFWGLQQNNDVKYGQDWQEKMYKLEMKVSDIKEYINIAFYNHIILRKA
ncbi:class I SAM-dependent methyltransferase [Clostridium senegalense]|uniref:class I SAM-dependent methyltransferase n=1 Tax=Clostridium senegalense TaxID=1465809 RepID=UPI0002886A17|nr:methyltransferase domain-containing protein [Clostridium senegalense]